jgi:PPP family 3-phenylpropionic acid transporter
MMTTTTLPKSNLFRIRLYYFILTGATGFVYPFVSLFYRRQGLTGTEIGLLGTVGALLTFTVAPLWGRWSDQLPDPRKLLRVAFISSGVVYLLISQQAAFVWLAVLTAFNGIINAGVEPMSDAMTLNMIKGQAKAGFGSIRLWGSLGWAITVLLSGWIIEKTSIVSAFVGYALLMVVTVLVLNLLEFGEHQAETAAVSKPTVSTHQMFGLIGGDKALVGLAIAIGIVWFTRTGMYQFQAIYLDQMGARESLIGLASTLGALIELPGMLWADHLIRRYGSHRVLAVTMLLYAISNAFVVLSPSVLTIMASVALGGVGFSFYSVGIIVFLSERAPMGQTATILAIFTSTLRGLILMAAAPVAGLVFDLAGAYWLYLLGMGGSLLGWLVFRLFVTGKRSKRNIGIETNVH